MGVAISRAQFLRGDMRGRRAPLRPPWALPEAMFVARCERCGQCVGACPEGIVFKGRGGFPELDFQRGECTFCAACLSACVTGALRPAPSPWSYRAVIQSSCVAHAATVCRSCAEQCPQQAIRFHPRPHGVPGPSLQHGLCTGCGACVAPCPVAAIVVRPGDGTDSGEESL